MSTRLRAVTGVTFIDDPDRGQREIPTFTCPHCMTVGDVSPKLDGFGGDDGGWCFPCGRLICKRRSCADQCTPFLRAYADSHKDKNLRRVI
jgi:hypothetical protein